MPTKSPTFNSSTFSLFWMQLDSVTKQLELSLGPDTADLALRIGVHSGPVTAGVLRGERARFQLFGDTMSKFVDFCNIMALALLYLASHQSIF
jgi:hypothetical protein